MTLIERIDADLKEAMKAKDELTLSTLRLVRTSLKNKQIEIMRDLTEEDVLAVMRTMVKQYKDAFADFTANGRKDLADRQAGEIAIIERYLPAAMPEAELGFWRHGEGSRQGHGARDEGGPRPRGRQCGQGNRPEVVPDASGLI